MNPTMTTLPYAANLVVLGGQMLFDESDTTSTFHVLDGEVLIMRNGQMVDLVQANELLDASIWEGATAIAWTDCVLQSTGSRPTVSLPMESPLKGAFSYTQPTVINQQLYRSMSDVN